MFVLCLCNFGCVQSNNAIKVNDVILEVETGFPFASYGSWVDYLKSKDESFIEKNFKQRSSEELFNKYKSEIEYNRIKYLSDSLKVVGYIIRPKLKNDELLPVIIYNRGGNRSFGQLTFTRLFAHFELISRGYILVASQYRGNAGGEGQEEFGGSDVNDVLNLFNVIGSIPNADTSRIGMYGWSRGGMMTYLCLSKTDRIKAAVIGAAPCDAFRSVTLRPRLEAEVFSQLIPNYYENKDAELRSRSPIFWADKLCKTTPILILHGSDDWRVDAHQVLLMVLELNRIKHPFRFVYYENGDHELSQHREEVDQMVENWFDKYLHNVQKEE